jgi:hypothetical protein
MLLDGSRKGTRIGGVHGLPVIANISIRRVIMTRLFKSTPTLQKINITEKRLFTLLISTGYTIWDYSGAYIYLIRVTDIPIPLQ